MVQDTLEDALERLETGTTDSFVQTQVVRTNELLGRFLTPGQINLIAPATPDWVVEPYAARGAITEIDGPAKHGKSTFWLWVVGRLSRGERVLGFPTISTPVIYLSEQQPGTLRAIIERVGGLPENVHFLTWTDTIGYKFDKIMQIACEKAMAVQAGMIVIDTAPPFMDLRGDAENNAGSVLEAMKPLQAAASRGLSVVMIRHERKGGGAVGESGRGSSAFAGAVDIIIQLRKPEGHHPESVRALNALSRYDETPPSLTIDWNGQEFVSLGNESAYKGRQAKDLALEFLPLSADRAIKADELLTIINDSGTGTVARTSLRTALAELVNAGVVSKHGAGVKGQGITYWRSDQVAIHSSVLSIDVWTNESDSPEIDSDYPPPDTENSFVQTQTLYRTNESEPNEPERFTYLDLDDPETEVQP